MRSSLTVVLALATLALQACTRTAPPASPSCPPGASVATSNDPFDPGDGQVDVVHLYRDAKAAIEAGRHTEALSSLLWAFDYGPIVKLSSIGVVAADVTSLLASLGKTYPPALHALHARKRWLETALRAGERLPRSSVALYGGAARALGHVDAALQTCKMLQANAYVAEQRELLCSLFTDDLLDAGMWEEAAAVADRWFYEVESSAQTEEQHPGMPTFYQMYARRAARLFGAMLRLGKPAAARRFAERALDKMPRSYNYAGIIAEARAQGQADMADELQRRAASKLVE